MPSFRPALGFALAASALYALLATALPDPAPIAQGSAAPAAFEAHAPGEHEGCAEASGEHACGLDAAALLSRFQAAVAERGAVHRVVPHPSGVDAVAGQLTVGLEARGAALEQAAAELAARHGLRVLRTLPELGQALLESDEARVAPLAAALAREPRVRFAEANLALRVALLPNDPFFPRTGQRRAGLEEAWDVTTGDPAVVVALLDTGVDPTHPDLQNRLVPGFDFVNQTATMTDDNGHGTAMAGIVAAEGQNAEGVVGVAFDGRLMPVKVADALGQASVADVAAGIDFAVQQGARVINLSMGAPVGSQALEDAVDRALAAGAVVVAAAGNDPIHHAVFPARYPGVVAVTALGLDGELGYDAVLAQEVACGAPGEELITTLPGGVYGFVSGSSGAAAFASGVAALCFARDPLLSGADVSRILRVARRPIAALKGVEEVYRFGALDAGLAVARADRTYHDVAVSGLRVYPAKPVAGQPMVAVVEVTNEGNVALTNQAVRIAHLAAGSGQRIEIGVVAVALQPGERRELLFNFTAPATAGRYLFRANASVQPAETEAADNERTIEAVVDGNPEVDVRVVDRSISDPTLQAGQVVATVTVENRGTAPVTNVAVEARVYPAGPELTPAAGAAVVGLGQQVIGKLAVGARAQVQFTYAIPTPAPTGLLRLEAAAAPLPGEVRTGDNAAYLDFLLGGATALRGLYQQSNGVDVIPDAATRVNPGRPYVPVQVFVPSKGGQTTSTKLKVTRTRILERDTPTGGGNVVYDDAHGAPPAVAAAGLEIADEMGRVRSRDLNLFEGRDLDMNGRHEVLRLPRAALGVPPQPTATHVKYLDVKVEWEHQRLVLWVFNTTRSGSHRSVLRVRFSPAPYPALPGDNHYHDVHHHTIAEWYFGSPLDIFAPRKAYGGPLQMVMECAYVMGVIDQPTAQAAYMKIITTDHASFNNRTIPDPDSPDHRPPFGPQSPSAQPGLGQLEAYRTIFGDTAGEEVAFKQDVPIPQISIPFVNNILNVLPGIPLGAHMLLYRADHVEGPWHGGGWLRGPGNPNIDVELFPLLSDVAKNRQGAQGGAFSYAAHPFGGQGWSDANIERAFGLDPAARTRDEVHDQTGKFVLKGLEFFNGRGTRSLPTNKIDFNDLNPWEDATFTQGSATWDRGIWNGMTRWHEILAQTLEYSFVGRPEQRFVRKVYQAGGSDAHGDFNFSTGRAATPLNIQATYNVGDETWYAVRTYCLGDGKNAPTSEERWLEAYADGNSVTTDGPLLTFSLDADGRFDSADLRWHDQTSAWEDADGRIGGDGPLDGGFTALVRRGSAAPVFRYRYASTDEFGPVASVLLYKTEAGAPNPTRSNNGVEQIVGVNSWPLGGANTDLDVALDPAKEGPVTRPTAFAAGAYTGGDPDVMDLGPDNYRCYTNPVYAVPYDVDVTVASVDSATGTIPAGALEVRFTFDVSMDPAAYAIEVKALDANGESSGRGTPALGALVPVSGSGWADRPGIQSSVLTVVNQDPIPVSGDAYPQAGSKSFVVYWRDAPRDAAGNALNPIAATFTTTHVGSGTGSTASPSTGRPGGGSRGGGGGCSLATAPAPADASWLVLLALGGLALGAARRCARAR